MRASSVKTTSFHSATHILPSSQHWRGDMCSSASRLDKAMDVLWKDHSAVNNVEWYVQTLNDDLQTQCAVLRDEAHFWFNGYVNKQNCRIWSEANPQVYVETPLHPEKLTVWCALWAGGIIGPYFFKNDERHNVTVNGDHSMEP
ncbi:uncharacterized protein TNCV_74141 [Trichonephila clavipes]|nr:uncharacterized protein TNCV_74141 [Trichonephila clavipes]